ncbi:MAG: ABC transporter ATP-binding protein [Oscillospiraceae bacterium]|nr:ABC transporter ATP-binding protein [Oscillospiraceae bacterium]
MIVAQNVTKTFGTKAAVKDMNCTIPKGCIYGLIGSNGAGKSTFLRLITGIYRPDNGEITVDGQPVYENPKTKAKITFVPDDLYFPGGASMNRMADLYANVYAKFDRAYFTTMASRLHLDPKKPTGGFSKGMRRQAATILALATRPDYIFFDETFDGLDPVVRNMVKNLIAEDVIERQTTVILTSHSLRELEDTCDQLALLHMGGVVFESDVQDLQTTSFKVQIAFSDEYDSTRFEDMELRDFNKRGSVSTFIVRGDREQMGSKLRAMNPVLLDILPLSLEEVFIHEMQALGYAFDLEVTE